METKKNKIIFRNCVSQNFLMSGKRKDCGDRGKNYLRAVNEVEYKKASILFYEQNNISYFKQVFMEQFKFAVKNHFILCP